MKKHSDWPYWVKVAPEIGQIFDTMEPFAEEDEDLARQWGLVPQLCQLWSQVSTVFEFGAGYL